MMWVIFSLRSGIGTMKLSRAWRLDLAAAVLLVAGLLVAVAVASRDPADDPGRVYPAPEAVHNLLGPPGAWFAAEFVGALGVGVFGWLAAWAVFVLLLMVRRNFIAWVCQHPCGAGGDKQ